VIDRTLASIKALDAGGWFRAGCSGYRVPTLAQMLTLMRGNGGLYIEVKHADPAQLLNLVKENDLLEQCFFWGFDTATLRELRVLSPDAMLMAPRWMYSSIKEAAEAYDAQIIEFDAEKDDLFEISLCKDLGVKSMIYSRTEDWDDLSTYLKLIPDMINLDRPDKFKILASYPDVRHHFEAMTRGFNHGQ